MQHGCKRMQNRFNNRSTTCKIDAKYLQHAKYLQNRCNTDIYTRCKVHGKDMHHRCKIHADPMQNTYKRCMHNTCKVHAKCVESACIETMYAKYMYMQGACKVHAQYLNSTCKISAKCIQNRCNEQKQNRCI